MAPVASSCLEQMSNDIPCRKVQLQLLLDLFHQSDNCNVPALFLYGHTATGKTLVLTRILQELKIQHVKVNCIECYNARLVYEHVLNHVSGETPGPSNDYVSYTKCDNMNDFARHFKKISLTKEWSTKTICLVFENAERLRDMEINLLPGLLRLCDLTGLNIAVILESEIVWEKFRVGTGFLEPMAIHFPDYSKDELLEIMCLDAPEEFPRSFYHGYTSLLLSIFHHACRNLCELRHLAALNFQKYVEPVRKEEASQEDTRKLWRNIEPHLKKALTTVYLREISSSQWEKMQEENTEPGAMVATGLSQRMNIELPFYSKYLLIAAYLASYNPAKSDKRFFATHSGKINKRAQLSTHKKHERTSNQLLGPKAFPLDRLMAIFYSIMESRVAPTANIFSQVTSLVALNLMSQISITDPLETPKYKCLVSLQFVRGVAKTVNFDIVRYLFDFIS